MDKRAWQATVHGVVRVRHDLATKPPPPHIPSIPVKNKNFYSRWSSGEDSEQCRGPGFDPWSGN